MLTYSETIFIPVGIYQFKVKNNNTRKPCEMCPKLKTPERRQLNEHTVNCHRSGVFLFNYELVNVIWEFY